MAVEFDWDEEKSERNVVERGLPFSLAEALFQSSVWERPDTRKDYGELRVRAFGVIRGRLFVCVYTDRIVSARNVRWIISLRKANGREVRQYHDWIEIENGQ